MFLIQALKDAYNYIVTGIRPEQYLALLEKVAHIIIVLVFAKIIIKVSYVVINKFFDNQRKIKISFDERKSNTLAAILKSILRYVVYFIAFTTIIKSMGIPTESILAAAGLGGLAIGFGAQGLVKDVITGFFILFEDQFSVGDFIITGNFSGIVEEMGLRVTKLKDFNGDIHIIPNGSIDKVTNKSRGSMRALVEVSVAYEENIDRVISVLERVCTEVANSREDILEGPIVQGVNKLGESEVVIAIMARTKPMQQWAVERDIRKRVKDTFDREGIEIPYPRRVMIQKTSNKGGSS